MAYTLKQLTMAWTAVHDGIAPDAATTASLTLLTNASFTDAQAISSVLNSADDTTAVAVLAYQFFTGKSPTKEGIDYLVNSAGNPNDLNDAYYAKFNLENRYINFAANLGVNGAGAADFAAKYGAMSFEDYVASIYQTIIGEAYAKASGVDVAAAVAYLVGTKGAVLATAKSAGMITDAMTPAQVDIALKAAMAGLVMAASIKSDIGLYAASANNFMLALAKGDAVYNTDITKAYGALSGLGSVGLGAAVTTAPVLPGGEEPSTQPTHAVNITLGAPGASVSGTRFNDTFHATDVTFSGSSVRGQIGNDVLTITGATGGTYNVNAGAIRDIETVNLSNDRGVVVDTTTWTGLQTLNVNTSRYVEIYADTATNVTLDVTDQRGAPVSVTGGNNVVVTTTGATDGDINVAAVGDITVSRQTIAPALAGQVAIVGGVHVDVTLTTDMPLDGDITDMGIVLVAGLPMTESVKITGPASLADNGVHGEIVAAAILIQDFGYSTGTSPNTIKTVEVDGFDNGGLTFFGSNLQTLKASHGTEIYIDNSDGLTTPEATTLNDIHGILDDEGAYETLNITQGADASEIDLGMDGLKTLTLDGVGKLTLTVDPLYTPNIETVTIDGGASFESDLSGLTHLTSVDASGTTGDVTVTIDGSQTEYAGGDGDNDITFSSTTVTKAISLGDGDDRITLVAGTSIPTVTINGGLGTDTLVMDAATAQNSATIVNQFTGFERLVLANASNQSLVMSALGFHHITTSGATNLFFSDLTSGDTLVLDGAGANYFLNGLWGGASDSLDLVLQDKTGAGVGFGNLNTVALETLNITTQDDTASAGATETLTLSGSGLKTVVVSGNAGLTLTSSLTALTSVDASGITDGGFTWTAGSLAGAATIKGSATGTNTVSFSSAVGGLITYEGGSGADDIRGNNLRSNVVHLGEGDNSYYGYAVTITAGDGDDDVTLTNVGANVQLGDGNNTFLSTVRGIVTLTTGSGDDKITIADGTNTIDVGTGDDLVKITAVSTNSDTQFHSITGFGAGDKLDLSVLNNASVMGTELTGQTSLADYLALANDVAGTTNTLHWFVVGADIYILADHNNATSFQVGSDSVVRLVGAATAGLDPSAATVSAGLITFQ